MKQPLQAQRIAQVIYNHVHSHHNYYNNKLPLQSLNEFLHPEDSINFLAYIYIICISMTAFTRAIKKAENSTVQCSVNVTGEVLLVCRSKHLV